LTAPQTWSVGTDGDGFFVDQVTGGFPLTVDLASGATLITGGPWALGRVAITGPGSFAMEAGINATDGADVAVGDGAMLSVLQSEGSGPLSISDAGLRLSNATLTVNGPVSFDGRTSVTAYIGPVSKPPSSLSATGSVSVAGQLVLEQGEDYALGTVPCPPLAVGHVYTLVSTVGSMTGTFSGLPNGAERWDGATCPKGQGQSTLERINYTSHTVTATVVPVPGAAQIRAALSHLLRPTGRKATIAALLRHRGYEFVVPAIPGRMGVDWYARSKGRWVYIAGGLASMNGARATRVGLKLNRLGRHLLAHAHRTRVLAKAFFIPPQGTSDVNEQHRFRLKAVTAGR
jgi:hypothetical protein